MAWEYYYRKNACKAEASTDASCICWREEGTGPHPLLTHKLDGGMTWRKSSELEQVKAENARLRAALEHTRDTIDGQLTIIAQRAPGKYLDKVPVVRSLKAHWARCAEALTATALPASTQE